MYCLVSKKMPKQKQPLFRRLFHSKLAIVTELVILVLLGSALVKEILHKYQIENEINDLQAQIESLESRNGDLHTLLAYLNSDAYTEEQARLKLGLQKPGESVVAVLGASTDTESEAAITQTTKNNEQDTIPNPKRWWNYFVE